jgi:hypothetical protein
MNCDLENTFLLVYLSGPLIITHGPRGATPADPPPISVPLKVKRLKIQIIEKSLVSRKGTKDS